MPANYSLLRTGVFPIPKNGKYTYFWHIANKSTKINTEKTIEAIRLAMDIWQKAIDNVPPIGQFIKIESTSDINKADIIFSFGEDTHNIHTHKGEQTCPFPFDNTDGTLAHAWSLITTFPFGGQVHMDDKEQWDEMHTDVKKHLLTVLVHELGHVWNLAHSDIPESIMYPTYNGIKTELHEDDLAGLEKVISPIKYKIAGIIPPSSLKKRIANKIHKWLTEIFSFFR